MIDSKFLIFRSYILNWVYRIRNHCYYIKRKEGPLAKLREFENISQRNLTRVTHYLLLSG